MLTLEKEMTYRFKMKGPLAPTSGSPNGERQYWEMSEGVLTGNRINARIALPGGDWMAVGSDGFWRPDVRVQFITEDNAVVLLHYTGLVQQTERFVDAATEGRETQYTDQYMRMIMRFDTGAPQYSWLNQSIFIAEGRLAGPAEIEYQIYRVV